LAKFNFQQLNSKSTSDEATEPRRIFAALPQKNAKKYEYPRDVQTEVWERWHERRDEPDLVIKMNTGGGKTVVGLLILKSCLNEKQGPVIYVAPNSLLAQQVRDEARELGLAVTDDPRSPQFRQSRAILVTHIQRLVNGLSVFGVTGDGRDYLQLGSVIIDDAHACLAIIEEQFTLTLNSSHAEYASILRIFEDDIRHQSSAILSEIQDRSPSAALQIPTWAWADKHDKVLEKLSPHRNTDELRFVWPLIRDDLSLCRAAISGTELQIKPPCPPIDRIPSLSKAKRRIYLTATLADDGVLITHLNANVESLKSPVTPKSADDIGDRLILRPMEIYPDLDVSSVRRYLKLKSSDLNVVVIVPSKRRAEEWAPYASQILDGDSIQDGVQALRNGHVGLVVLVNRYDGIDLPDEACRILVLDGLPEAMGAIDRIEANALQRSRSRTGRQLQRIEQGMGRGVRSNKDFCVVLLMGPRLTERIHLPAARLEFGAATRAQLSLSDDVADRLLDKTSFKELDGLITQFLERDVEWVQVSRDALDGVTYEADPRDYTAASAIRAAFDLARRERYQDAVQTLDDAINNEDDTAEKGWLKQQAAAFMHFLDPVRAQTIQISAQGIQPTLLKPIAGAEYQRLTSSGTQGRTASEYLTGLYKDGNSLLIGVNAILDELEFDADPSRVEHFEQAFSDLGKHLGFETQRPEKESGEGPDVLWLLGELRFLVIECKSGVTSDRIAKKDAAQLGHSCDWFLRRYGQGCKATPLLVHPREVLSREAVLREGSRILTEQQLGDLKNRVRAFATSLSSDGTFHDPKKVNERLVHFELAANRFPARWSMAPRIGR